jgi:hypothetical protein
MIARARALAALGAYLCLATHVVGILHVLTVRHATCPDHGEVIHGDSAVVAEAPVLPGKAARDATRAEAEETDEHCLLMATRRRELAGLAPGHVPALFAPTASALEATPVLATVTPRALLRLAPKTSPPASV